jgi:glycolate oxidase FAD binding subunit
LRDLLIGIAVAHPSGTVTKAGGMVVKNVTGFDLPRLYHGSMGTLGIIVSANFKILPVARFESSVLSMFPTLDGALEAAMKVRASRLQPLALEVTGHKTDGRWLVAVRLTGREQSVNLLAAEARTLLGGDAEARSGVESQAWWKDYTRKQAVDHGATDVLLRCTSRPSATATMTHMAMTTIAQYGELIRCDVSPGLGAVLIRVDLGISGGVEVLAALRDDLLCRAERVTVLAAPSPWKIGLDVWGPPPPGFDVMRSLKEDFDPHRVLNPGRFAGFL